MKALKVLTSYNWLFQNSQDKYVQNTLKTCYCGTYVYGKLYLTLFLENPHISVYRRFKLLWSDISRRTSTNTDYAIESTLV